MITREDDLKLVYRPDGTMISEFGDGTRITSFYMDSSSEFTSKSDGMEVEKYVKIECPGFATTIFNTRTSECSVAFGDGTLVSCEPNRNNYKLIHRTGELLEISGECISFLPR